MLIIIVYLILQIMCPFACQSVINQQKNSVILGTIKLNVKISMPLEFQIRYNKGLKIQARHDKNTESDTIFFDFSVLEQVTELFILITEAYTLPENSNCNVEHFLTHPSYPYRIFKLVKQEQYVHNALKTGFSYKKEFSWQIEELDNKKQTKIPDNTLIIQMPVDIFEGLGQKKWTPCTDNILYLPEIKLKKVSTDILLMASKRSLSMSIDLRFFYTNEKKALILCGNQHLISVPINNSTRV